MPGLGLSHVLVPVPAGFGHVMSYFLSYYFLILPCMSNVLKRGQEGRGSDREPT